jgi:transposase
MPCVLFVTDEALRELQPRFHKLYANTGRPSIAPEKLLRTLLLQALYSVPSERLLIEQLDITCCSVGSWG